MNPLALNPRVDPPVKSGGALVVASVGMGCRVGPKLVEVLDCVVNPELATLELPTELTVVAFV